MTRVRVIRVSGDFIGVSYLLLTPRSLVVSCVGTLTKGKTTRLIYIRGL